MMKLYVCISLDVEEEGLFCGAYPARDLRVRNVALLPRLAPLWRELGLPLTLYCAHSVFVDAAARDVVLQMRDQCGAEIGAHLHHWSTPPLDAETAAGSPLRTHLLAPELLERRLAAMLTAGAEVNGAPLTSFRMGRWDLKNRIWPLLVRHGIKVDSSICPLRIFRDGADHFFAPADPYWIEMADGAILEAPVTQIPLARFLPVLWRKLAPARWADLFHFFGALSANPFWHQPWAMRLAARLHAARGGLVLNFFWHSSEMLPGASPHVPDQAAAALFLRRIFIFCRWLRDNFDVAAVTASQLPNLGLAFPRRKLANTEGDW